MFRRRPEENGERAAWASASLALAIPGLMAAGPIVGYLLGDWIRSWTGWGSWTTFVFTILGAVSGGYETYRVIRRMK